MGTQTAFKTIKNIAVYNLASVLPAAIGFLITPLLSHYLKPADYGVIALISTYLLLVQPVVGFVASGLITVEYFKMKESPQQFASLFSSISIIPIIPVILLSAISYFFFNQFCSLAELPLTNKPIVTLIFFVAFLVIINETFAAYLVIKKKYIPYAVVTISKAIVEVGLTLLFVVKNNMGWEGRIYALYVSTFVLTLSAIIIFYNEKLITTKISKQYILAGLAFGAPLIFHMFGKFAINQSDRIFLAKMENKNELGIYNMAYMFGSLSLFYISALVNYLTPYIFERLGRQTTEDKKEIVRAIQLAFLSLIGVSLLVIGFSYFVYYFLIDRKYFPGLYYIPWIALSYVFWGGYNLLSSFYFQAQKTKLLGTLGLIIALINLFLNYILISIVGTFGAVLATLFSFMIVFFVVFFYSKKIFDAKWFALARTK